MMNETNEKILSTITKEQWVAIAEFAVEKAKKTSAPEGNPPVKEEIPLKTRVTNLLCELGVPAHIKGYGYLRHAIMLAYQDHGYIEAITKALYPEVADEFRTTGSRVERAIRHAIEVAWSRGDMDLFKQIFNWSLNKGKPTNSEFIAFVVEYLQNS